MEFWEGLSGTDAASMSHVSWPVRIFGAGLFLAACLVRWGKR